MPFWFRSSAPLPAGSPAPDFTLPDETGRAWTLSALRGRNVVLVFYPGDETYVCTKQLCALRDRWPDLEARNTLAFGVNPANQQKHAKFHSHHAFPFPLLVDKGQHVARLYQANGLIVKRTVYLIGPDGLIRYAQRGNPGPEEILSAAAV